jgi:hypothetical protein
MLKLLVGSAQYILCLLASDSDLRRHSEKNSFSRRQVPSSRRVARSGWNWRELRETRRGP